MRDTDISPTTPREAATDQAVPAWRLWLTHVYVREALARVRGLIDDRRRLRGRSGAGWRRKGLRRRLAHAAAGLLLILGGIARGLSMPWPAYAATIPFTGHSIDGAFAGAISISFADLDGDGDLDVLGAAIDADAITWWENDGTPADGGWTTHTIDGAVSGAASVVAADLDGDGDLDVLGAANVVGAITWWESDGTPADGGWTAHTISALFLGAVSVAAADLDGDGDLDVLGAAFAADDIAWWENDGTPANGGWTTHTITAVFDGARSVAAADLDGDGDLDVLGAAVTDPAFPFGEITWWENDGAPADGGWTTHTIITNFSGAASVAAADLDMDGDLDVLGAARNAAGLTTPDISWWENDGTPANGGWTTHNIDTAFNGAHSVAAADLDGDGDLDIVGAAQSADTFTWWENDGTPADGGWTTHTIAGGFDGAISVAAADLDGDGDLDVFGAARSAGSITWWENRTIHRNALLGGTIPFTHTIDGAFSLAVDVNYADLDGDGDLDVLGAALLGDDITWWESDGTPADGGWTTHTIDGGFDQANSVATADLDGDGDTDVLGAASLASDITWWENDGTPANGGWTTHTIDASFLATRSVAAADLDGDGDTDVLGAAAIADDITWWENDGTPANGGWTTHTIDGDFDGASSAASADLDGDGDLDVIGSAVIADDITWWENDGTPANGGWTTHTIDAAFGGAFGVAVADLDGDGDLDVLGVAAGADAITWWENDGTPANGGWITHTIDGAFDVGRDVAAADLDGDGDFDVLGAAQDADDVTWWENDGTPADGGWTTHSVAGAFNGAYSVAAADLDGDGDVDVLGAAGGAYDITWWQNKGGQFTLPTTGTAPGAMNPSGSDDFLGTVFTHNGRGGDNDEELTTLQLRFEDVTGAPDPLTTAEANAIIEDLHIYVDDGSGVFESGSDTLVTTVGTLALDGSGDQIVTFADDDPNVQLPFATGMRTYFVVLELTTTYPTDPARNGVTKIRVTHITEASSTAGDRPNDLPLAMAFTANTQSSAGGTEFVIPEPPVVTITDPLGCTDNGDVLNVQAVVNNPGGAPLIGATVQATLPVGLTGLAGTCTFVGGSGTTTCTVTPGDVTWTGDIPAASMVTINYQVRVSAGVGVGDPLCINTVFDMGGGVTTAATACTTVDCAPTSVDLRSFSATAAGDRVTLTWETATEADALGFNVYRSTEEAEQGIRVNPALIPATGGAAVGEQYALRDAPPAKGTYSYRLEVVNRDGPPDVFGPMPVRWDGPRLYLPAVARSADVAAGAARSAVDAVDTQSGGLIARLITWAKGGR